MSDQLKQAITGTLIRRALGYVGVSAAAANGLQPDIITAVGALTAALTLCWSVWGKISAARKTQP